MVDTSQGAHPAEDAVGFGGHHRDCVCGHHDGRTRGTVTGHTEIWGKDSSIDSATVEHAYDMFAETGSYDETFDEWGYVGPETAAAILKNYVPRQSRILDAACGSGLTGTALRNLG